jgi:PIN domain nuclease of toxin-antitoxin system
MNLLLDTHAFLWFMEGDQKLSARARAEIEGADGRRTLSVASLWEMAIKASLDKLTLAKPLDLLIPPLLTGSGIELLPIELGDVARVAKGGSCRPRPARERVSARRALAGARRERPGP